MSIVIEPRPLTAAEATENVPKCGETWWDFDSRVGCHGRNGYHPGGSAADPRDDWKWNESREKWESPAEFDQ